MMARTDARPPMQRTVWWKTAASAPAVPPLASDASADVVVIGAGFTGLTAAWNLARRGVKVIVLEASRIAAGASGLNAGFVVPNFAKADPAAVIGRLGADKGRRLLRLIGAGADGVFDLVREHAIACDAEQVGWMHIAHSQAMLEVLRARAAAWRELGRPVTMLDEAAARALSGARHCVGALLDPSGGMLHPLDYAHGLAALAIRAGATIHACSPVTSVARDGGGWRVRCRAGSVVAERVLLCTNAFEIGAARRLGRAIVPLHVYQVATEPLPPEVAKRIAPRRTPAADTRANLFTYRLDRDNRLISGGMAIVPIRAEGRMAGMILRRLVHELELAEMPRLDSVWRGTAAMTTDFLPHLYPFGPGFIGGIGCNGRGIALTRVLGDVLADAITGRSLDDVPIPVANARGLPLRFLAEAAPSVAIARAKWQDRRQGL